MSTHHDLYLYDPLFSHVFEIDIVKYYQMDINIALKNSQTCNHIAPELEIVTKYAQAKVCQLYELYFLDILLVCLDCKLQFCFAGTNTGNSDLFWNDTC